MPMELSPSCTGNEGISVSAVFMLAHGSASAMNHCTLSEPGEQQRTRRSPEGMTYRLETVANEDIGRMQKHREFRFIQALDSNEFAFNLRRLIDRV